MRARLSGDQVWSRSPPSRTAEKNRHLQRIRPADPLHPPGAHPSGQDPLSGIGHLPRPLQLLPQSGNPLRSWILRRTALDHGSVPGKLGGSTPKQTASNLLRWRRRRAGDRIPRRANFLRASQNGANSRHRCQVTRGSLPQLPRSAQQHQKTLRYGRPDGEIPVGIAGRLSRFIAPRDCRPYRLPGEACHASLHFFYAHDLDETHLPGSAMKSDRQDQRLTVHRKWY